MDRYRFTRAAHASDGNLDLAGCLHHGVAARAEGQGALREAQELHADIVDILIGSQAAGARGKVALKSGEVDGGVVSAGMVIGLIHDIPTCAELIERIVGECREQLRAAAEMAAA